MILAAGLTPAWQQTLVFDELQIGEVNRAVEAHWGASGKVANVGIALAHLGGPSLALMPLGGATGRMLQDDLERLRTLARIIPTDAGTRTCTTLLDRRSGRTTELVENARPITDRELSEYVAAYLEEVQSASTVVLSGSLAPGAPGDFYQTLMQRFPQGVRFVLDARGPELRAALEVRPFVVKPNREELGKTFGRVLKTEDDVWAAMAELNSLGAEWVVISEGASAVRVTSHGRCWLLRPPALRPVNPIGCGDCLAAGIAWALDRGDDPLEAIRWGIAAAGDNLTQLLAARLDRARVEQILSMIPPAEPRL